MCAEMMTKMEDALRRDGRIVCGIDEVGRGPLYGDVVAAAVILPEGFDASGIDDSKKLSEKKREVLAEKIRAEAVWAIGSASAVEIDAINILNATRLAMRRAVENLAVTPEILLIDAVHVSDIEMEQYAIVKGDEKSVLIGAASIVAKVFRDARMREDALRHPEYGFEAHKGYGTKKHLAAIDAFGLLPNHRRTFLKKHFGNRR